MRLAVYGDMQVEELVLQLARLFPGTDVEGLSCMGKKLESGRLVGSFLNQAFRDVHFEVVSSVPEPAGAGAGAGGALAAKST